jgi:hypothetical protein
VAAGVARRGFLLGAAAYLAADCLSDYVSLAAGRGNWAAIASVDSVLWSLLVPFAVAGTATAVIEPSRTGFLRSVYVALAASVMVYLILGAAQAAWALVGLTSVLHEPSGALTRVDPRSPIAFAALSWLTADIGIGAVLGYLFAQSRSLIRGPGFRVLEPGCRERFWEVARAGSRVGAANEGEMHIRGREIAGVEVEVTVSGHQCVVVASSASSARVNGAAFSVAYLRPGDVLTIGSTQLVFELPDWRRLIGLDRVGGFWGGGC